MKLFRKLQNLYVRPFDMLPLKGVGCEVGVFKGEHAAAMLSRHKAIHTLWLVDPWTEYHQEKDLHGAYETCLKRMVKFGSRVRFYRTHSPHHIDLVPRLDFCYIDSEHSYESVKSEIAAYWPKIKNGGYLGGHDFHSTWPGVVKAVTEFAVKNGLDLNPCTPDWIIKKP